MSKSNTRRFVRAAWSLLFFQVIASAGAVGVTGWVLLRSQASPPTQAEPSAAPAEMTPTNAGETPAPAPSDGASPNDSGKPPPPGGHATPGDVANPQAAPAAAPPAPAGTPGYILNQQTCDPECQAERRRAAEAATPH